MGPGACDAPRARSRWERSGLWRGRDARGNPRRARGARRRPSWLGWIAVAGCPLIVACTAYRVPPLPDGAATAPERVRLGLARVTWPDDVKLISKAKVRDFLARLQEDLVATGLFEAVVEDDAAPAAVIVAPQYEPRRCYSQPLVMILTLGIVPESGCYYSGYHLVLRGPAVPGGAVSVDNRSAPLILTGLVAGPLRLMPGWESSEPRDEEVEALRAAIVTALQAATAPAPDARRAP